MGFSPGRAPLGDQTSIEAIVTRASDDDHDLLICGGERLLPPSIAIEITLASLVHAFGSIPRMRSITVFSIGLVERLSELELRCDAHVRLAEITRVRRDDFPRRVPVMLAEIEMSEVTDQNRGEHGLLRKPAQELGRLEEPYAELRKAGLQYGDGFRALVEPRLWANSATALIRIAEDPPGYCFPPAAMESGFQLALLLLSTRNSAMPPSSIQSIDSVWLASPHINPTIVSAELSGTDNSVRLAYYDDLGRLLALIEGARFGSISSGWPSEESAQLREALAHAVGWALDLGLPAVRPAQTLVELGLDSLRAVRLRAHLRERYGLELPMPALLDASNLWAIVPQLAAITEQDRELEACETAPRSAQLTPIQRAYWIGARLWPANAHTYFEVKLPAIDADLLERALNELVASHPVLRTVIRGDGTQEILEATTPAVIRRNVWTATPDAAERLQGFRASWSHRRRDLSQAPLFELAISSVVEGECVLHASIDLVLTDLESLALLTRELIDRYEGHPPVRRGVTHSFLAFAMERTIQLPTTARYRRAREYWKERLHSILPPPQLPTWSVGAVLEANVRRIRAVLAPAQRTALLSAARAAGVTESAMLCGTFGQVLGRWSAADMSIVLTYSERPTEDSAWHDIAGDFTSTIVVSLQDQGETTRDTLMRTQREIWQGLEHAEYSGVDVMRELAALDARWRDGYVVFTSGLGHSEAKHARVPRSWLDRVEYGVSQTPHVLLDCQVIDLEEGLAVQWDYVISRFPSGVIEDMFAGWLEHLSQLADQPSAWDRRPQLLPAQQAQVRSLVNDTRAPIPGVLLHQLLDSSADRSPNALAVVAGDRRISYAELKRRSERLASALVAKGVSAGARVGVSLEKGWEQAVAVLGILRASAIYVPVSPQWPVQRVRSVLETCQPELVLMRETTDADDAWNGKRCSFEELDGEAASSEVAQPTLRNDALAYILFTSGTTGAPKGVMIDHRAVVNRVLDVNRRFEISERDRIFGLTALEHDMSVYDLFGAFAAGAAVIFPEARRLLDPAHWCDLIRTHGATIWNTVPAFMGMLLELLEREPERAPESLRHVWLSGDSIPPTYVHRIRRFWPDAHIASMGGATETTIWDISYEIGDTVRLDRGIPYGKPMANAKYHVLNPHGEGCPNGVSGELFAEGVGLARGYWQDERRTAEKFVRMAGHSERLYRTGDRGKYQGDGTIEFLGRLDRQVKIRGTRVELEEIENALRRIPGAIDAAVVAIGEKGNQRLVGFLVAPAAMDLESKASEFLRQYLPRPMIPARIIVLADLPLTWNGKVDTVTLEALATRERIDAGKAAQAAQCGASSTVGQVIADHLGVESVQTQQRLFALGLTSVDLVAIESSLRARIGRSPGLAVLFADPTVEELDQLLEAGAAEARIPIELGRDDSRVQVFCFPSAGAAAHALFSHWKTARAGCEIIPIDYPGHGSRLEQAALHDMGSLVADLVPRLIATSAGKRVALYGQSMGALVAFEVAVAISLLSPGLVGGLSLGVCPPPHRWVGRAQDPAAVVAVLRRLSGSPELDAAVDADMELLSAYGERSSRAPAAVPPALLSCAIDVFYSDDDPMTDSAELVEWQRYTRGAFAMSRLSGGHFFKGSEGELAVQVIDSALRSCAGQQAGG